MRFPLAVQELVEQCATASRVLGSNPYMTLHGGGNTSVKTDDVLFIKASGFNLATLEAKGLAPLNRFHLDVMLEREHMSDSELVAGYRKARLEPGAAPSIEALLHNFLPHRFVLHSHADAIVTLTNISGVQDDLVDVALGSDILRLPYSMPGFELAKTIRTALAGGQIPRAIVQDHHGLFTFAETATEALEVHEELVQQAERYISAKTGVLFQDDLDETQRNDSAELGSLRAALQSLHDGEVYFDIRSSPQIDEFLARPDLSEITARGGATLEHVIRTKRWPMVGVDADSFVDRYREYFERQSARYEEKLVMLDPLPRVALVRGVGLVGIGRSSDEASIAADIYRHTARIISAAELLGRYESVSESQSFDIEYWELEQAKIRKA
ncbi:class II aldolase/adducin family protein [Timonella senegalensis]|uniref:class II aldolase/adducin family protein n=1 Tax=Timonella senegalensis TaxID=1465825 RepID=UPI0002ED344D|nr:class II aldolase/adducin family protein [Timonella senegalensis]